VEFGTEEEASANVPPEVEVSGEPFVDQTRVLHQTTKHPIVKVRGGYDVKAQVVVIDEQHGHVGATECLAGLVLYLPKIVDYVIGMSVEGVQPEKAGDAK
jgi:hypothetical protein